MVVTLLYLFAFASGYYIGCMKEEAKFKAHIKFFRDYHFEQGHRHILSVMDRFEQTLEDDLL